MIVSLYLRRIASIDVCKLLQAFWASNQYLAGPLGHPQILCGRRPPTVISVYRKWSNRPGVIAVNGLTNTLICVLPEVIYVRILLLITQEF